MGDNVKEMEDGKVEGMETATNEETLNTDSHGEGHGVEEIEDYMNSVRVASASEKEADEKDIENGEPVNEKSFTGDNPLLKGDDRAMRLDDAKNKDNLEVLLEQFNLFAPLTDMEKGILEGGVNDEVFEAMHEKLKDAETSGDLEAMEKVRKLISLFEKVKSKGLRSHYIEIDGDTGDVVRGNYGKGKSLGGKEDAKKVGRGGATEADTSDMTAGESDEEETKKPQNEREAPSSSSSKEKDEEESGAGDMGLGHTPPQTPPAEDSLEIVFKEAAKGLDEWLNR